MRPRILLLCLAFIAVSACTHTVAQATGFNRNFTTGFAVEYDYRVRDASLSKSGKIDTTLLTAETDVTAAATTPGRLLLGTSNRGIFESEDRGKTWVRRNVHRIPMALDADNQRRIYAFDNTGTFATHKHDVLYRTGSEEPWQTVKSNLKRAVIFTSIHRGKTTLYLGTSVNGLEMAPLSDDALKAAQAPGKKLTVKFSSLNAGLPGKAHNKSHFIYEEVQAIFETAQGDLLVATGPRPAVYLKKKTGGAF